MDADKPRMLKDLFALHAELATMHFVKSAENPYFKSKYQDYPSLLEQVKPVLLKYHFIWVSGPEYSANEEPTLHYELVHASGQVAYAGNMLLSAKGTTPQDQGGAITYGRRYALTSVLDIAADEDDDGNKATDAVKAASTTTENKAKPITELTSGNIYMLLKKLGKDPIKFEDEMKSSIDNLSEDAANKVVRSLMADLQKQAASK